MNHITDDDLIDYLHHEVSDNADVRIHAHLAGCAHCGARYDAEAAVGESLRAAARTGERELPPFIKAQVWAAIRAAEPTFFDRFRAGLRPTLAVPVAAALAVLTYFGLPIVRGDRATSSPTVAAAFYFEEHAAEGLANPLADRVNTNTALAFRTTAGQHAPLIDAAQAATLDDVATARE